MSRLLLIQAVLNLDQKVALAQVGLTQRPKQPMAGLWQGRPRQHASHSSHPTLPRPGERPADLQAAPCCSQRPRPWPQTVAVQNSLLADGTLSRYLFPHSLLCMSAKNLPVISKLRQKVPPVLTAADRRLPLHKNDLQRTKGCSVGRLPCKDI